jgi:hypothetical protein
MARPKTKVSVREFLALITAASLGSKIVSLATRTRKEPGNGMVKKHRLTGQPTTELYPAGVERRAVGRFILGFDYANNVNAQRERENKQADFVAEGLWVSKAHPEGAGRHDEEYPAYMVYHVDSLKQYLRTRPHQNKQGRIVKEHDGWFNVANGQPITGNALADLKENLLDKHGPAKKQDLDKEIPVRCVEVPNIVAACYKRWYIMV